MDPEAWQLLVAAFGGAVLLFSAMFAMMQYIVRQATKPLAELVAAESNATRQRVSELDTKIDALGSALRAEMAELRKELRAEIAQVRDGLHELAERVARLEGALRMESRVGVSPQAT